MRRLPGPIAPASLLAGILHCLAPAGLSAQALPAPSVADTSVAEAIARARHLLLHHMEGTGVPGVQVAVWRDGRIVWSEGLGWADAENRAPVGPETRFPVGSVSKALTAVGAVRLADRGELDLDAPVRRYVPRVPRSYEGVTPRLLGQHLAGIRHYRGDEEPGADRHFESVDEALDLFLEDSLLFEPGTRFAYSSYGFNLLSAAMEGAAGEQFLTVMEEEVFGPLGLNGTMANEVDRLIPFRTQGYTMADGRRVEADEEDPSYKWAGGGFLSTAEDLVRVGAALLEPGFLSEEGLSTLFTEARPAGGERTHYGFGWELYRTEAGRPVRFHGGNLPYARAHLMILPEDRLVLAHLANTGTSIFFNNGEAQWLAELFLPGRAEVDSTRAAGWSGGYAFRSVENTLAQD
ncbi:MAG: serine hydrolase domain-containing protein, partial [Gemmatimonadota bacterium]|nr:serine hydrolase domain-containing protein [Gemmatimonadota bacterium]